MTPETHEQIKKLAGCTFLPGSSEKRFARMMASYPIEQELTEKQLMFLGVMLYRYRKQIKALNSHQSR